MKNDYCDLPREEIVGLPEPVQGILLSPFQFTVDRGYVRVPEDTFKFMVDLITNVSKVALAERSVFDAIEKTHDPRRQVAVKISD